MILLAAPDDFVMVLEQIVFKCCIFLLISSITSFNSLLLLISNPIPLSIKILASGNLECLGPKTTGNPKTTGSSVLCNLPVNPPPIKAISQ